MAKSSARRRSRVLPASGLAAVAALAVSKPADAQVIHVTGQPFTVDPSNQAVFWDIDGDTVTDFKIHMYVGNDNTYIAKNGFYIGNAFVKSIYDPNGLRALPLNYIVGPNLPASKFASHSNFFGFFTQLGNPSGELHLGQQFIGFKFVSDSATLFGWANITIAPNSLTFTDWAYQSTPGAAILVGTEAIPEPATAATGLGLLALGAAGVSAYKRRKAAAALEKPQA
jgi:hypothetical protein